MQKNIAQIRAHKLRPIATTTGTCRPRLPVLIYSRPFVMSQICEMQVCQCYKVKRIKSYFHELRELWKKVRGTFLLPQVVLISSIKPISSYISKIFSLQSVAQPGGGE